MAEKPRVGPVVQAGELAQAVAAAVEADNPDGDVRVTDRGAYVRIEASGECIVRRESVERELGRPFKMHELELSMPGFAGRIDTSTEAYRFYTGDSGAHS